MPVLPPGTASIVLVGMSANFPNPGVFVELDFAQGPAAGAGGPRAAIILGNKTTSGSATVETVVYGPDTQTPCQTENDVINLFGTGSQIHRQFLRWTAVAGSAPIPLYFCAVTESAGAQATATMTFTGTATGTSNCRIWCGDDFVDFTINTNDNVTAIAGNAVLAINSKTRWPVTASNVAGAVTFTARNHGPEGNWIRVQSLIQQPTSVVTTTTSLTTNTFLSGGTTADNVTNALATIQPSRYYYIISGDSDATNVGRIASQLNSVALPTNGGRRQRVVFGSSDTLANTITIATGLNAPRAECVWGASVDLTPAELAANNAAIYAVLETGAAVGVARKNFSNFPVSDTDQAFWKLIPGRNGVAGAPTDAQITSALNNGITPIALIRRGAAAIISKRVTTRSLNGSTPDYRTRDGHKVTVCDYWCDDAQAITQQQCGGKDLLPDPIPGGDAPGPNAITPTIWANILKGLTLRYGKAGQWGYPPGTVPGPNQTPADVINALAVVQAENNPPTRLSALYGLSPVPIADQFDILAQQVG